MNEEAIKQRQRAAYMKELKAELSDINQADVGSGPAGLLRHIYNTYPPKNPDHKLDGKNLVKAAKTKRALLTAIQHYHPDKQDEEQHGKKWAVLCEEITKLLTDHYGRYKCCD